MGILFVGLQMHLLKQQGLGPPGSAIWCIGAVIGTALPLPIPGMQQAMEVWEGERQAYLRGLEGVGLRSETNA